MSLKKSLILAALSTAAAPAAIAQTSYTSTADTNAWNAARWNNAADAAPYTSAFTSPNAVSFTAGTYTFNTGIGAGTINVGNVTVSPNVTVSFTGTTAGTYATGGAVRTFDVGANSLLDFASQGFSTAAGTGFIKNGPGVLALSGGSYTGGFTLNNGIVILRGVNAMGDGGALTINGGTIAGSATRNLTGKYTGGITIGGDFQLGAFIASVPTANDTANLTFSNNMALGAASRTITLGNRGTVALGGIISGATGAGVTFAAVTGAEASASGAGRFDVTNAANTFTGDINLTGAEVRFTADGSLGNAANDIIIDGGRFATLSGASFTLDAGRDIFVGDNAGTSISTPGAGVLTYNNAIQNKTGEIGSWAKQGGGTLALGGVSTYSGSTAINNGTLQLTTGNNRLPTGTVLSLGQAASANVGILNLDGFSQAVAGLNSTTGTNAAPASNNTITSATAATLTISGSGSYSYGDGTDANSGIITGAISLIKQGSGTQVLGDANTYTGPTTVSAGTLVINGSVTSNVTVQTTGTLGGSGTIGGSTTVTNGTLAPGNSAGTLTMSGGLALNSTSLLSWELNPLDTTIGSNINDLAAITGNLTLDGTLNIVPTAGSFLGLTTGTWTLATYTGTLTDNGLLPGSLPALNPGYGWSITAGGGSVTASIVSAIPEPGTWALLGIVAGTFCLRARRKNPQA